MEKCTECGAEMEDPIPHVPRGLTCLRSQLAAANAEIERLRAENEQLKSKAIHTERIPVPPHLAEAQRVVIKQAQQAGDGAEEK